MQTEFVAISQRKDFIATQGITMLDKLKQPIGFSKVFLNALILVCALGLSSNALADYLIGSCTIKDPVDPPFGTECPGQDISGLDFSNVGAGIDLRYADLTNTDINNTDFSNSDLSFADLTGADDSTTSANFTGVTWEHTICPDGFKNEAHIGQTCVGAYLDTDSDGVTDAADGFPSNAAASIDSDSDGYPDYWDEACDAGCQGGSGLEIDKFPNNSFVFRDDDDDGFPESCDATCETNSGLVADAGLDDAGAIFVDANTPTPYGSGANGLAWNTAWPNVADALAVATAGQEIWIAEGVYYPDEAAGGDTGVQLSTFNLKHGTSLVGGFSGGETLASQADPKANLAILSGDIDQNDSNKRDHIHTAYETVNDHNGLNAQSIVTCSGAVSRMKGLNITGGGNASNANGGGVSSTNCSLFLEQVNIFYSRGDTYGAGIYFYTSGGDHLKLKDVLIRGAHTENTGGALYMSGGTSEISSSTIADNTSDNSAAGIHMADHKTFIENSTIVNNTANWAAGINVVSTGIISGQKYLHMVFSTLAFNSAISGSGGGIYIGGAGDADIDLQGTVVTGNTATASGDNIYRGTADQAHAGYSSIGSNGMSGLYNGTADNASIASFLTGGSNPTVTIPSDAPGNLVSNALVDDHGGYTPVLPLPLSSPLIDAIDEYVCLMTGITEDQRGMPRPYAQAPSDCDIGAYEANDQDADGVPDNLDAFPTNEAASIDSDADGFPDEWNVNCDTSCQSGSGLVLDKFPDNPFVFRDDDDDGFPESCDATCETNSGLAADAGQLYVDIGKPWAGSDGLGWSTAFPNVADALAVATAGQEIWIAAGIYFPDQFGGGNTDGNDDTFTLKDQVALVGGFDGSESMAKDRDAASNPVILSGDVTQNDTNVTNGVHTAYENSFNHNAPNSLSIVTANSVNARLTDITITGAQATTNGAGIKCSSSNLILQRVRIFYSSAGTSGGSIYCLNGGGNELILEDVHLEGNHASQDGGGIWIQGGKMKIERSTISNNSAGTSGGGMHLFDTKTSMGNSTIAYNTAQYAGGVIVNGAGTLTMPHDLDAGFVTFAFNSATGSGGTDYAGALMLVNYADVAADGSVFIGNTSVHAGSANIYRTTESIIESNFSSYGSSANAQLFVEAVGVATPLQMFGISNPSVLIPSQGIAVIISNTLGLLGGKTPVLEFPPASPLLNAIPEFDCKHSDFFSDQRGERRPSLEDLDCDIGAFERNDFDGDGDIDNVDTDDDDDGISDAVEDNGDPDRDTDGDGNPDRIDIDSDNDGMLDVLEEAAPVIGIDNRLDLDSDDDGVNDVIEAGGTDSNGDGMADGMPNWQGAPVPGGLTPPNTDGTDYDDPWDTDSDNDGMDDGFEETYGLNRLNPGDASGDLDGDTLTNLQEYNLGRNPNFADFAEPETDLVISPKSYRYVFEFDTATCDTVSTPVTYTIKNNDTVSRNITGAITFDNVVNSTDWKIKSGTDTCSSSPISPGASCTFDVVFCAPNAAGNHAGEINVPTDSVDTPILTSALYNYEADHIEAERRLPPVISELVIRNLDQGSAIVTDGNIQSGDLHSYEWTITGYHPTFESALVIFNCDGLTPPACGANYNPHVFDSGLMTPTGTAAGTWTYNGIIANTYTYTVNHTLIYNGAETNEYVLRFYRKSGQDVQAGNSSLSGLIPGNIMPLSADYYDTAGRRIIINVTP